MKTFFHSFSLYLIRKILFIYFYTEFFSYTNNKNDTNYKQRFLSNFYLFYLLLHGVQNDIKKNFFWAPLRLLFWDILGKK